MTNNNNFKSKVILVLVSLIIIIALGITYQVLALNPPANQPPTGGGTIGVGSNAPVNSLYITSAGNVGIGTTNPGQKLYVSGDIGLSGNTYMSNTSPTTFYVDTNNRSAMVHVNSNLWYVLRGCDIGSTSWCQYGSYWPLVINLENNNAEFGGTVSATAFYYRSDQSLKTNIKPFDKSLQKVLNLEPVYFDYKENNQHSLGFIAQDVEKQFPELVTTDSLTGLKSLDYSRLTAPLVMAIKEQQEQINALTQIVESQQQQINELKTQLNNLQQIVKTNN